MADVAHGPRPGQRDQFVFALVLIVIGVVGLISQLWQPAGDVGGWIVLVIGVGFIGAFLYTRQYGYLVPGGIMTGLGTGIVVSQLITWTTSEGEGGAIVLGLGLGFVSIWAIGLLAGVERNAWWPLVPGGILAVIGSALLIGGAAVDLLDYWGIGLVVIGIVVLYRAWTENRRRA